MRSRSTRDLRSLVSVCAVTLAGVAGLAHCGPGRVPPDVTTEPLDGSSDFDIQVVQPDGAITLPDGAVVETGMDVAQQDPDASADGEASVPNRDAGPEIVLPPEDAGCVPYHVPDAPAATTIPTQPNRYYVLINLALGATREAWSLIGLDRDNRCGSEAPAAMPGETARACAPQPGAGSTADGADGRDNAFAAVVAPVLRRVTRWNEADVNAGILSGRGSVVLRIVGANLDTDSRLSVEWHRVVRDAPSEGGRDESWIPVSGATGVRASEAYVTGSNFVARFSEPLDVDLAGVNARLHLRLNRVVLSGTLIANPEGGPGALSLTRTVVSGLWSLADAPDDLRYLGLCPGTSSYEEVMTAARNAADALRTDAREPETVCDAVTVGIGLDMTPTRLDPVRSPPSDRDLCMGM